MKPSRLSRTTAIRSLCVAVLAGVLWYHQHQIWQLSDRLATSANAESMNELVIRLGDFDERLDQLAGKNLVSSEDFRAGQQALSNRIDTAQKLAEQAAEANQGISPDTASLSELLSMKAEVETLARQLRELGQQQHAKQTTSTPTKAKPSRPNTKPQTQTPPFTLVGVEYRGGERFLSVGPLNSTKLSQLYLIQPGDMVTGTTWRLKGLEDGSAHFEVAGKTQVVPLGR